MKKSHLPRIADRAFQQDLPSRSDVTIASRQPSYRDMAFPAPKPFRLALQALLIALGAASVGPLAPPCTAQATASGATTRQPVLVELFTSEGCSSCPPADALLAQLDATQFVPGAQAIVLSEHVTYWNHLGWVDPFSLPEVTERQQQYATHFGLEDNYTPQAVVDGAEQFVGNEPDALVKAVTHAAQITKPALLIQDAHWNGGEVSFSVHVPDSETSGRKVTLMAALAQDATQSVVPRGENAGRTLRHVAVVRAIKELSPAATDGRALHIKFPGQAQSGHGHNTDLLRLVVFLADRRTGHVLSVAQQVINRIPLTADAQLAIAPPAPAAQPAHPQ